MIKMDQLIIIVIFHLTLNVSKALINRIWNGDFPTSWNNSSIVSIHKKGDPSDCNNYRGISLINNRLKIIAKIIAKIITNRISKYGI